MKPDDYKRLQYKRAQEKKFLHRTEMFIDKTIYLFSAFMTIIFLLLIVTFVIDISLTKPNETSFFQYAADVICEWLH